ncbi:BMC domain-containing protein [Desulfosporosinus fructosivorans]|uniref:BMC domain-containing protein n=1 Tax=Desulfosporosinus fructosivorans TaxID=2018669 RepID=A0A4Z0R8Q5_9FIRM|nr:BMC domain-containing protein [Desulfosporosinus fructosivorans]TGE38814.1 BMC domain-containing protein [Desulfosporosinus fructosivorans]
MVRKAFGLIETVGLVAALEAADAALKAANIELIGYELTKGKGMVLVKFSGDVGAIKVAVEAGRIAAGKVNKVVATHVIPRPHQQLSSVLATKETSNRKVQAASEMVIDIQVATNESENIEEHGVQLQILQEIEGGEELEIAPIELNNENPEPIGVVSSVEQGKNPAVLCNFCRDPACHRKKGDPKVTCIHYGKNNEEAE